MEIGGKTLGAVLFALVATVVAGGVGLVAVVLYVESRPNGTEVTPSLIAFAALLLLTPPLATAIAMIFFVREAHLRQAAARSESAAKLTVGLTLAMALTPVAMFMAGCIGCTVAANVAQITIWRSPSFDTTAGISGFAVGAGAALAASIAVLRSLKSRRSKVNEPPG